MKRINSINYQKTEFSVFATVECQRVEIANKDATRVCAGKFVRAPRGLRGKICPSSRASEVPDSRTGHRRAYLRARKLERDGREEDRPSGQRCAALLPVNSGPRGIFLVVECRKFENRKTTGWSREPNCFAFPSRSVGNGRVIIPVLTRRQTAPSCTSRASIIHLFFALHTSSLRASPAGGIARCQFTKRFRRVARVGVTHESRRSCARTD